MKLWIWIIIITSVLIVLIIGFSIISFLSGGDIVGQVIDCDTGQPIDNAKMVVSQHIWESEFNNFAFTNESGEFKIHFLKSRALQISLGASKENYLSAVDYEVFPGGKTIVRMKEMKDSTNESWKQFSYNCFQYDECWVDTFENGMNVTKFICSTDY